MATIFSRDIKQKTGQNRPQLTEDEKKARREKIRQEAGQRRLGAIDQDVAKAQTVQRRTNTTAPPRKVRDTTIPVPPVLQGQIDQTRQIMAGDTPAITPTVPQAPQAPTPPPVIGMGDGGEANAPLSRFTPATPAQIGQVATGVNSLLSRGPMPAGIGDGSLLRRTPNVAPYYPATGPEDQAVIDGINGIKNKWDAQDAAAAQPSLSRPAREQVRTAAMDQIGDTQRQNSMSRGQNQLDRMVTEHGADMAARDASLDRKLDVNHRMNMSRHAQQESGGARPMIPARDLEAAGIDSAQARSMGQPGSYAGYLDNVDPTGERRALARGEGMIRSPGAGAFDPSKVGPVLSKTRDVGVVGGQSYTPEQMAEAAQTAAQSQLRRAQLADVYSLANEANANRVVNSGGATNADVSAQRADTAIHGNPLTRQRRALNFAREAGGVASAAAGGGDIGRHAGATAALDALSRGVQEPVTATGQFAQRLQHNRQMQALQTQLAGEAEIARQANPGQRQPAQRPPKPGEGHHPPYIGAPITEAQPFVMQKYEQMAKNDWNEGFHEKSWNELSPDERRQQVEQRMLMDDWSVGGQSQATNGAPVQIHDEAGYNALPPGTQYIAPDGQVRIKAGR